MSASMKRLQRLILFIPPAANESNDQRRHLNLMTDKNTIPTSIPPKLVLFFALLLVGFAFTSPVAAQIQIVNCDAQIQSAKRGIPVNTMSAADFQAVAPGVSWYYNWGTTPLTVPNGVPIEFIPMVWNGSSGFLTGSTGLSNYLAAGNTPTEVFALNEPNFTTQANMTPSNAAVTFKKTEAICAPYNIPVIAPHMALGTPANQSITAYDPIQGSNVTYTAQAPYLAAFEYYCGSTNPAGMGTHSYGGYGEITGITGTMHTDYPTQTVWLTEFNASGGGITNSSANVIANLIQSVDYCERTPWIKGYAWFMSRITGDPYNSLLSSTSGVLTAAGQVYVQMPVHETNIYYLIPGQLQAARYVTMTNMTIGPTTDATGLADMIYSSSGASANYNLQVNTAGSYPLAFRVGGASGTISVYENGKLLGTATNLVATWSTVSTTVNLPAGTQTLTVVLNTSGQHLNWLQFQAANGPVAVPTGLSATNGFAQVALKWPPAAGATSYNVQSSTNQDGPYSFVANVATTSYTNTGLVNATTYYYVVSATDGVNVSSNSFEVNATPKVSSVNLALNKPVTVSSTQSGYPGGNVVDGNLSTRWGSSFSDPQWIYVDLQTNYYITEVWLDWNSSFATSFQIQVSADAINWTHIYSTTTGTGGFQDLTGLSGTGRYVRLYGTARGNVNGTVFGYSLYEMQVFGVSYPVLAPVTSQTILAGGTLTVFNSASDLDAPPLTLTYGLTNAPAGAAIDSNSGVFTWRPAIAQSPSTQNVSVVVSDNNQPALTVTQSFQTTVLQPAMPALTAASIANGQFGFWINGNAGPDYIVQESTNLASWTSISASNPPVLPYFWVDTNSISNPYLFYRVLLGP
jgi:hypothetical protein